VVMIHDDVKRLYEWLERNGPEIEGWRDRWVDFVHLSANVMRHMPHVDQLVAENLPQELSSVDEYPPNGTTCSVCHQPQFRAPGGLCCMNGHGGADPDE
jgi:hypothetical protein